jgi:hypothetical protein
MAAMRQSSVLDGGVGMSLIGTHNGTPPRTGASGLAGANAALGGSQGDPDQASTEQPSPFAGMGPFLEDDDAQVFKAIDLLVYRQEPLAKNRFAMDEYYTFVKNGHGLFVRLEKVQDQAIWRCEMAPGANALTHSAVPNKLADLCCKVVETLLVDPPQPNPEAENDSEEAERAVEMAEEFLRQDGGEAGTRDARFMWAALDAATSKSAAFGHYWVDASGNGSVPLQIKAHPYAQNVEAPLTGPNGEPTNDYILRYVTADGPNGEPPQFTDDPSQAARQWQPKICIDEMGREHVRCYPETTDVTKAEMVITLWYCTLDEGKRRWPETVGKMEDGDLSSLCDWTPPRYFRLLPPALRARWKLSDGEIGKDRKGSTDDQRVMFFYTCYRRSTPTYPKGCVVSVNGMADGLILGKDTLTADVPTPDGKGTDVRDMDIPLTQWDLVLDADDKDPMCKPLAARVDGSNRATSRLAAGFTQALDTNLNPAVFTPSTSPVTEDDVNNSRATGAHVTILSSQDTPFYEPPRTIPANLVQFLDWEYSQMDSAFGVSRASTGADKQQEVSGVARSIAVQQANIALSRMQQGIASSYERHCRIKLQLAMKYFSAPQMIRYPGEDGAYKQEWFNGQDFSKVTGVKVASGTNTMMSPQARVAYVQQMQAAQFVSPDDAIDAVRPSFSGTIGLAPDPQQQRIERQVSSWLKGPPSPEWIAQAQAFNQAKAVADQQNQQNQAAYQQQVQPIQAKEQADAANATAKLSPAQPAAPLPPPPAPVQPMDPATGQPAVAPWTPFDMLPMDDEPMIAALRQRRLKNLMAKTRFTSQPPEWQEVVKTEYNRMRSAVAAAAPFPAMPKGVSIAVKADPSNVAQAEQAAAHPQPKAPA